LLYIPVLLALELVMATFMAVLVLPRSSKMEALRSLVEIAVVAVLNVAVCIIVVA
jgi:hypothetical protein